MIGTGVEGRKEKEIFLFGKRKSIIKITIVINNNTY